MSAFTNAFSTSLTALRRAGLFSIAIFALFIYLTPAARAQSALDGFNPGANLIVYAVAVQPDGKIIIGGLFTNVTPSNSLTTVPRNYIARFNPDGTLDTTFNPNADNTVYTIVIQPDGKILIGGFFSTLTPNGGAAVPRNRIARLNIDGTVDAAFNPDLNGEVFSIAVQPDGKVLAGGSFTTAAGGTVSRNRIARFDGMTGAPDSFDPNVSGSSVSVVRAIALQSNGKILIGGAFTTLTPNGGAPVTRNNIARLNPDGTADSFDPNASSSVYAIAVQADGKIVIGGFFISLSPNGGATVATTRIARLNTDGSLDTTFNPSAVGNVRSIVIQTDGKILVGGVSLRRLNMDGTDSFILGTSSTVFAIAVQSDGKVLAGGAFTTVTPNGGSAVSRLRIVRLERDGRVDQTLDLSTVGTFVTATAIQPDGKIIIGGRFSSVLGTSRNNIARLNTDGTLDATFDPNANGDVYAIAVQSDGKILAGGNFNIINGTVTRNFIARLDATTGVADSFDPNANTTVRSITVQSDGKILASGNFTTINGTVPRNFIARLDATTGAADSFDPNANGTVLSIAVQPDGKILVGGDFTTINGTVPRNRIARFNGTTGAADSFDPNVDNTVFSIAVQSDGKVLAGGNFTTVNNSTVTRVRIARFDGTTGAADSFDPSANNLVFSIALQPDGKILAGGFFGAVGGQGRSLFARLSNDTAARSTLTVTKTSVTLTRDGSAAQFSRVIFEQSLDNGATYTLLGTATNSRPAPAGREIGKASGGRFLSAPAAPTASGYNLTGLNLPSGQNILIRARGFFNSGYFNGSQTIEDKVQIAYFAPAAPTAASVTISGRALTSTGRGIRNVLIRLTDGNGNARFAYTTTFGYYRFRNVEAGETYVITAKGKRFEFSQPSQILNATEDASDVNFVAR